MTQEIDRELPAWLFHAFLAAAAFACVAAGYQAVRCHSGNAAPFLGWSVSLTP